MRGWDSARKFKIVTLQRPLGQTARKDDVSNAGQAARLPQGTGRPGLTIFDGIAQIGGAAAGKPGEALSRRVGYVRVAATQLTELLTTPIHPGGVAVDQKKSMPARLTPTLVRVVVGDRNHRQVGVGRHIID